MYNISTKRSLRNESADERERVKNVSWMQMNWETEGKTLITSYPPCATIIWDKGLQILHSSHSLWSTDVFSYICYCYYYYYYEKKWIIICQRLQTPKLSECAYFLCMSKKINKRCNINRKSLMMMRMKWNGIFVSVEFYSVFLLLWCWR